MSGAKWIPSYFKDLLDTPSTYSGQAGKRMRVNAAETALIFLNISRKEAVGDYGLVGNGTTDNGSSLQSAINTLNSAGGGILEFETGTYLINSTIRLKNYVYLFLHPGAVLKWGGASGGTMFDSDATTPLVMAGVQGGKIDPNGLANIVFDLHSAQMCSFGNHAIKASQQNSIIYKCRADATASTGTLFTTAGGGQNFASNIFANILVPEDCGTFFYFSGTPTTVVTLNTFHNIMAHACYVKGLDFVNWVDNNFFTGVCRVSLWGNNAIGVDMNSGAPTTNNGVYANHFDLLAVDTFQTYVGRKGIQLGWSRWTKIASYFQDPAAESGSIVDNASQSHYIVYSNNATGGFTIYRKGVVYA